MTFDARKISVPNSPFEFIGLDGQTYAIPNINTLSGAQAKRLRENDESVLAEICDADTFDAIDAMTVGVQAELSKAWVAHGQGTGKAGSPSRGTSSPRRRRR
ncbi:hypothetical protein [Streptomyces roseolus]|uniref:hypothetical protein n=1 Tax=Streptomyces roseolus TaxID=67358 RepID=UPI0036960FA9